MTEGHPTPEYETPEVLRARWRDGEFSQPSNRRGPTSVIHMARAVPGTEFGETPDGDTAVVFPNGRVLVCRNARLLSEEQGDALANNLIHRHAATAQTLAAVTEREPSDAPAKTQAVTAHAAQVQRDLEEVLDREPERPERKVVSFDDLEKREDYPEFMPDEEFEGVDPNEAVAHKWKAGREVPQP